MLVGIAGQFAQLVQSAMPEGGNQAPGMNRQESQWMIDAQFGEVLSLAEQGEMIKIPPVLGGSRDDLYAGAIGLPI